MSFKIQGISKAFRGSFGYREILKDVDLSVKSGEVVGLAGRNGSGKSTLIKIILGVLMPDKGNIEVSVIQRGSLGFLREGGYDIFENLTVSQNLQYFCDFYDAVSWSQNTELQSRVDKYELRPILSKRVSTLSRGQKQILSVINATIQNPDLVILDEPTLGLDQSVSGYLQDEIRQGKERGVATLIATHDFSFLDSVCDRIAILHNGNINYIEDALEVGQDRVFEIRFFDKVGNSGPNKKTLEVSKDELALAMQRIGLGNICRITECSTDPLFVYKKIVGQ